MRKMEGYTIFNMSYNDMLIVNMAIMDNINIKGNKIDIAGKPVYEFCSEFSEDVKVNILKLLRLAYARESFNIINRIWKSLDKDRAMLNYPEWYWANELSALRTLESFKEAKKSVEALELSEKELCIKRIDNIRVEAALNLLRAGYRSIWVAYRRFHMLTSEDVAKVREYTKIKNSRELSDLQLSMCGILHYNMQNAPFSEVIRMVEE